MAVITATRAAAGFPVSGHGFASNMKVAWGTVTVSADPAPNDYYEMCKVPRGATVLGGYLQAGDIDTDASETLDVDVGWLANGDEVADLDGFGNFGILIGDAVALVRPEVGSYLPLGGVLFTAGPKTFNAETTIVANVIDDAATLTAGPLTVVVFYVMS
jgi:hypothetical protein